MTLLFFCKYLFDFTNISYLLSSSIPIVGEVIDVLELPAICKRVSDLLGKGGKTLGKVDDEFDKVNDPLDDFSDALNTAIVQVEDKIGAADSMAKSITWALFLAYEQGKTDFTSAMNTVVNVLNDGLGIVSRVLNFIIEPLSVLNEFSNLVESVLLEPIQSFASELSGVFDFFEDFSFLETIMDYQISIKYPSISWGYDITICFWGCWTIWIPWPSFSWAWFTTSVREIGNWIQNIINDILSIPIIGFIAVSFVQLYSLHTYLKIISVGVL